MLENKLGALFKNNLDFHDENSTFLSHGLHAFPAKFPPQLPSLFIQNLTEIGETVLDPMMGSGTTLVEACRLGRRGIGFDIDPLAVLICKAKTTRLQYLDLLERGQRAVSRAREYLFNGIISKELMTRFDPETRAFLDYWFAAQTQKELMALKIAIERESEKVLRQFLEVVFSSVIITKSGGVTLAKDLAHSRPHRVWDKQPKPAIEEFEKKLLKMANAFSNFPNTEVHVYIRQGDARQLELPSESVDLIVTSPPYSSAIDYVRAHKFSRVWFGESIEGLRESRKHYVGAEVRDKGNTSLPAKVEAAVSLLSVRDIRRAQILRKYYVDMKAVMSEMHWVLKPGKAAVVVVGSSRVRGINIEAHECLASIAWEAGFKAVKLAVRNLDRDRRMLPFSHNRNGKGIEYRMDQEYLIGLIK